MKENGKLTPAWVGFPESTEEQIEEEVVGLIARIVEWKKRYYQPNARWRVGTTNDASTRLEKLPPGYVMLGVSSWHLGSATVAAREIAEHHGMELEGSLA